MIGRGAGYHVLETVEHTGGIGARVVDLTGLRFRCGTASGEVAVSDRAQRFTELLVVRVIPLEREGPRFVGGLLFVCQPIAAAAQELSDFVGIVQGELGRRGAVAVLVVAHDHPDAVEPNGVEGVFVGEIVADVDGQHAARLVDLVTEPGQRGALVPIDVGSQLDHLAAARHPQAMPLSVSVRCRDDLGHAFAATRCGSGPRRHSACARRALPGCG